MTNQHTAVLRGDYLKGTRVLVTLDEHERIINCTPIRCIWQDTPRFDDWFRAHYNPHILYDGGEEYWAWLDEMSRDDDSPELIAA